MLYDVLEPNCLLLEKKLREASTVDQVLHFINDFLDTCLQQCLLTDHRLVQVIIFIFIFCCIFCINLFISFHGR